MINMSGWTNILWHVSVLQHTVWEALTEVISNQMTLQYTAFLWGDEGHSSNQEICCYGSCGFVKLTVKSVKPNSHRNPFHIGFNWSKTPFLCLCTVSDSNFIIGISQDKTTVFFYMEHPCYSNIHNVYQCFQSHKTRSLRLFLVYLLFSILSTGHHQISYTRTWM